MTHDLLLVEEVESLAERLCNDEGDESLFARIEELSRSSLAARRAYVEYLHLHASIQWYAAVHGHENVSAVDAAQPLERGREANPELPAADRPASLPRAARDASSLAAHAWRRKAWSISLSFAALSMVALLAALAVVRFRGGKSDVDPSGTHIAVRQFPAVLTHAAGCRWSEETGVLVRDARLAAGKRLLLEQGVAEVTFQSGAVVLLEAPAEFTVSNANAGRLDRGKLFARVKSKAAGFSVDTPDSTVVDLGTEFGLRVEPQQGTEVHVFSGRVRTIVRERSTKPKQSVELAENEAVWIDAGGAPRRLAAQPEQFVRRVRRSKTLAESFAVYSTGEGLPHGELDPHWEIVAASHDPAFVAQSAVVTKVHGLYLPVTENRYDAKWISLTAENGDAAGESLYTFRTAFDLAPYDEATAKVWGKFAADNQVVAIRLNGVDMPFEPDPDGGDWSLKRQMAFKLDRGFVPGENALEVVVRNSASDGGKINSMALLFACRGSACRWEEENGNDK